MAASSDTYHQPEEAGAVMGRAISVPMLRKDLRLSIQRVAAYQGMGQPLKPWRGAAN